MPEPTNASMKILHICYSDDIGGAAKAAFRIVKAQRDHGIDAFLFVVKKRTSEDFVINGETIAPYRRFLFRVALKIVKKVTKLLGKTLQSPTSLNVIPTGTYRWINNSDFDAVNLHWIGMETISLYDIAHIKKPLFWTCHDMWLFSGVRHIAVDSIGKNRHAISTWCALAVEKSAEKRKIRLLKAPITLLCPSSWLASIARERPLSRSWPVAVIPNCLDLDVFKPVSQSDARTQLGLPKNARIVLFGAVGGASDRNKGYDLLATALAQIVHSAPGGFLCCTFGADDSSHGQAEYPILNLGKIREAQRMATIYAASDVVVVPSRIENLPQVATEAQACGRPVIAFRVGGLPDIVVDGETGFLISPYDTTGMACAIKCLLSNQDYASTMGEKARLRAVSLWSSSSVSNAYREKYQKGIAAFREGGQNAMPIL